jgi:transposase-like protein
MGPRRSVDNVVDLRNLDARYSDWNAAGAYLERLRWPDGPVCPHCGEGERKPYRLRTAPPRRVWKCRTCRRQFTVTVGTAFESSHLTLDRWLLAFRLVSACSGPPSTLEVERTLGVTSKTALSVLERVRRAFEHAAGGRPSSAGPLVPEEKAVRAALALPPYRAMSTQGRGVPRAGPPSRSRIAGGSLPASAAVGSQSSRFSWSSGGTAFE